MNRFIIAGQHYTPLANKILEWGDEFLLLQDTAMRFSSKADPGRTIVTGFSDKSELLHAVDSSDCRADGVVNLYEQYILPSAWITEHLGLPGLPVAAAEASTDKELMRRALLASPRDISPDFAVVKDEQQLAAFIEQFGLPVILKPANLSKSLLIVRCNTKEEAVENYRTMLGSITDTYKKYAPARRPKIVVEQFMEGPMCAVDGFVDSKGQAHMIDKIAHVRTAQDAGFSDNYLYSRIFSDHYPKELKKSIFQTAKLGIKALGIKSSPVFVQMIITDKGVKIIEVGARVQGYRERMHSLATGVDILGGVLNLALDKPVDISATKNEYCAALELFPKQPGIFQGLSNQEGLETLKSLNYMSIKPKPGQYVGRARDGYKMCAVIILHSKNENQLKKDMAYIDENVCAQTLD